MLTIVHHHIPGVIIGALVVALPVMSGCAPYVLRGVVLEGLSPGIAVVDEHDPRLKRGDLIDAVVSVTINPNEINPRSLGDAITDEFGRFELPVPDAGAGFLEYEITVVCCRGQYASVERLLPLPAGDKQLLIVMVPGAPGPPPTKGVVEESLQFERKLK